MIGWSLSGGWKLVSCQISGGWWKKKVRNYMVVTVYSLWNGLIKISFFSVCHIWFSLLILFTSTVVNTEMKSGDRWILANINVTGFYRVNYDTGNWERLIVQLNSDHEVHTRTEAETLLHWGLIVGELCLTSNHLLSCYAFDLAVQVLPLINRAQLVDDIFNLARFVFILLNARLYLYCDLSSHSPVSGTHYTGPKCDWILT